MFLEQMEHIQYKEINQMIRGYSLIFKYVLKI